jgi:hypothetical protein
MEDPHVVYGVHVTNRATQVPNVQHLLTEYGCNIKTRIGLHHVDENACSPRGLILLEMFGDRAVCEQLKAKLAGLEGVDIQEMIFEHD